MRVRTLVAAAVVGVTGLAAFVACGGGEIAPASDAGAGGGADTSVASDTGAAVDAGKPADGAIADANKPCAIDADVAALLQIDAGGVDSGGIDLPACLSCINTSCAAYVSQCNGDCVCKQGVADFVNCTQKNPSQFQQCGLQLYTNLQGTSAQAIGQGLVLCAGSKCPVCIPSDAGAPIVDAGGKG